MVTTRSWLGQALSAGRYTIKQLLGQGGMAQVFLARDRNLDADVVVKIPHDALLDPDSAERFRREIRSLLRLAHPHIVMVTDVGEHEGHPFAVMPYLSGGSLEHRRPGGQAGAQPHAVEQVLHWLGHVAAALDFIHLQGFVHRDVKPGNILFDGHGNVFLSDFGVAKAVAAAHADKDNSSLTGRSTILGTPRYVAPEVVLGHQYDGKADQYSLAVTLYEILCGRAPFEDSAGSALLVRHTTQPPPPPTAINPALSPAVSAVLLKGLAKAPHARYENCVALARALIRAATAPSPSGATQVLAPPAAGATVAISLADTFRAPPTQALSTGVSPPPLEMASGVPSNATVPMRLDGTDPTLRTPKRRNLWLVLAVSFLGAAAIALSVGIMALSMKSAPEKRPVIAGEEETGQNAAAMELPVAKLVEAFEDDQGLMFEGRRIQVAGAVAEKQEQADGTTVVILKNFDQAISLPGPRAACAGFADDEQLRRDVQLGDRIVVTGRCEGLLSADEARTPSAAGDVELAECSLARIAEVPLKDYDALISGAQDLLEFSEVDLAEQQLDAAQKLALYAWDKPRQDEVQRLLDRVAADRKRLAPAEANLAAAKQATEENRLGDAVREYQAAARLLPDDRGINARLREAEAKQFLHDANLALESGDTSRAERLAGEAERKRPGDEETADLRTRIRDVKTGRLLQQASDAMSADDLEGALRHLNQALVTKPDDDSIVEKRDGVLQQMAAKEIDAGNADLKQSRYADAIKHYELAKRTWKSDLAQQQIDAARSAWSAEYKLEGKKALDEEKFDEAEAAFAQAVRVAPDDSEAKELRDGVKEKSDTLFNEYMEQADKLSSKGRQLDALRALERAGKMRPTDASFKKLRDRVNDLQREPETLDVTGPWEDKQGGVFQLEADGDEVQVLAVGSAMFSALRGTLKRNGKALDGRVAAVFQADPTKRSRDINITLTIQDSLSMKFRYEWILIGPTGADRGRRPETSLWTRMTGGAPGAAAPGAAAPGPAGELGDDSP